MCGKGKKGVLELLRTMKKLNCTDITLFWKLFDSQIQPIVTYAAEVWGLMENSDMEKLHTYAMKRFLNVPLHTSNKMIYCETGRHPLCIQTCVKSIKYWLRLVSLPVDRLCVQAYNMLLREHEKGKVNWVSKVKGTQTENGFGFVWLNQGVGNECQFLTEFKDRIISSYRQTLHANMENSEKYTWYLSFKNVFEIERHLMHVTHRRHRCNLVRFRTRTLGLGSVKKWYEAAVSGICPVCKDDTSLDDEIHFLFLCPFFENIRTKYITTNKFVSHSDALIELFSTKNEDVVCALAKYVTEAMDVREKHTVDSNAVAMIT